MALKTLESKKPVETSSSSTPGELSFEQLFERYYRPVSYFFANRGFSSEECRDLAQETFLKVYAGMDRFRHESSVETWLFRIARNVWKNALRSRSAEKRDGLEVSFGGMIEDGQRASVLSHPNLESDSNPLDTALSTEQERLLREAINSLPTQMRSVLLLRIDKELKYREIAMLMKISVETVKSQLFQAKDRLRTKLAKHIENIDF